VEESMSLDIRDRIVEFTRIKASELTPHPQNWRKHPKAQQAAMSGILKEVGYVDALMVRQHEGGYQIIDGHLRAETTPDATVPVLVVDLDDAETALVLATFDPLAAMAQASAEHLDALLQQVNTTDTALQAMLADVANNAGLYAQKNEQDAEPKLDQADELNKTWQVKTGDIWSLGQHRLMCGDSTKADDVARLMNGAKADMLLSDPPYGVSYVGKTKDALTIENDALDEDGLKALIGSVFDHAQSFCREGAYWYATAPAGPLHLIFADDWKRRGILRQIMVWAKDSLVMGHSEYHYKHEPIIFGWIPGERHKNSDRTRTTLWEYDRPKASHGHPTMKPVALWSQAVQDGSRTDEIVYDPFIGSGTTLVAAEQLNRKCYGMEISPAYCAVILQRATHAFPEMTITRE